MMSDTLLNDTANWESVDFPLIKHFRHNWYHKNATLSGLKSLFQRENLKLHEDYVIQIKPENADHRLITVKFKQPGQGLICLMQWLGSNYYNREHY